MSGQQRKQAMLVTLVAFSLNVVKIANSQACSLEWYARSSLPFLSEGCICQDFSATSWAAQLMDQITPVIEYNRTQRCAKLTFPLVWDETSDPFTVFPHQLPPDTSGSNPSDVGSGDWWNNQGDGRRRRRRLASTNAANPSDLNSDHIQTKHRSRLSLSRSSILSLFDQRWDITKLSTKKSSKIESKGGAAGVVRRRSHQTHDGGYWDWNSKSYIIAHQSSDNHHTNNETDTKSQTRRRLHGSYDNNHSGLTIHFQDSQGFVSRKSGDRKSDSGIHELKKQMKREWRSHSKHPSNRVTDARDAGSFLRRSKSSSSDASAKGLISNRRRLSEESHTNDQSTWDWQTHSYVEPSSVSDSDVPDWVRQLYSDEESQQSNTIGNATTSASDTTNGINNVLDSTQDGIIQHTDGVDWDALEQQQFSSSLPECPKLFEVSWFTIMVDPCCMVSAQIGGNLSFEFSTKFGSFEPDSVNLTDSHIGMITWKFPLSAFDHESGQLSVVVNDVSEEILQNHESADDSPNAWICISGQGYGSGHCACQMVWLPIQCSDQGEFELPLNSQQSGSPTASKNEVNTSPSARPTAAPIMSPTVSPNVQPSMNTIIVSTTTTEGPTLSQSNSVTSVTGEPTSYPTGVPTQIPTEHPTAIPSQSPSVNPTVQPSQVPSQAPSDLPTAIPTELPSTLPSLHPSQQPSTEPTVIPTVNPSIQPSVNPSLNPSANPSLNPSVNPTRHPSDNPTADPTVIPTLNPSSKPTNNPSKSPSNSPSISPTSDPTQSPSINPSTNPSAQPSGHPTSNPTSQPTGVPSAGPTRVPTESPSLQPSKQPTSDPTFSPSDSPTKNPTTDPTQFPSDSPTDKPTISPSKLPTNGPSKSPSKSPSESPSQSPSSHPTAQPTNTPSISPTETPGCRFYYGFSHFGVPGNMAYHYCGDEQICCAENAQVAVCGTDTTLRICEDQLCRRIESDGSCSLVTEPLYLQPVLEVPIEYMNQTGIISKSIGNDMQRSTDIPQSDKQNGTRVLPDPICAHLKFNDDKESGDQHQCGFHFGNVSFVKADCMCGDQCCTQEPSPEICGDGISMDTALHFCEDGLCRARDHHHHHHHHRSGYANGRYQCAVNASIPIVDMKEYFGLEDLIEHEQPISESYPIDSNISSDIINDNNNNNLLLSPEQCVNASESTTVMSGDGMNSGSLMMNANDGGSYDLINHQRCAFNLGNGWWFGNDSSTFAHCACGLCCLATHSIDLCGDFKHLCSDGLCHSVNSLPAMDCRMSSVPIVDFNRTSLMIV